MDAPSITYTVRDYAFKTTRPPYTDSSALSDFDRARIFKEAGFDTRASWHLRDAQSAIAASHYPSLSEEQVKLWRSYYNREVTESADLKVPDEALVLLEDAAKLECFVHFNFWRRDETDEVALIAALADEQRFRIAAWGPSDRDEVSQEKLLANYEIVLAEERRQKEVREAEAFRAAAEAAVTSRRVKKAAWATWAIALVGLAAINVASFALIGLWSLIGVAITLLGIAFAKSESYTDNWRDFSQTLLKYLVCLLVGVIVAQAFGYLQFGTNTKTVVLCESHSEGRTTQMTPEGGVYELSNKAYDQLLDARLKAGKDANLVGISDDARVKITYTRNTFRGMPYIESLHFVGKAADPDSCSYLQGR